MENEVNVLCRFCAEAKSEEKLIRLELDSEKFHEITEKLTFLHAVYVNISCDSLPKSVCLVCYDSLKKAYDFLVSVKRAQEVITGLVSKLSSAEGNLGDVDRTARFDDYSAFVYEDAASEEIDCKTYYNEQGLEIKNEPLYSDQNHVIEPKYEVDDFALDSGTENNEETKDLDVQDILNAALNQSDPNVSIYATELKEISKLTTVNSWCDFPWVCSHCGVQFESLNTLRLHSKEIHKRCYAFICDCKGYTNKDDFNMFVKHVIKKHFSHLGNQCYYCNEVLEDQKLKDHIDYHFVKSQRPCSSCGEILKDKAALEEHILNYAPIKKQRKPKRKPGDPITEQDLTCQICKKVYKNLNSLRDHKRLHNLQRKRDYTCDRCGKTFFSKGSLKSHILAHDQVRPHVCKICNKAFLFANMLRRHVDMHSGVKPFACEQCGKRFRLSYQLKMHKIIHTDEMPYGCRFCSKKFRFKQIMVNHERQHTGIKPYSCDLCAMEFTNWSNYNKHMKRRHNMDLSKKKYTPEGVFNRDPRTGQLIKFEDEKTEEWKSAIMKPSKRGKKTVTKTDGL